MLEILPFISEFMVSKPEYPADTQKKKNSLSNFFIKVSDHINQSLPWQMDEQICRFVDGGEVVPQFLCFTSSSVSRFCDASIRMHACMSVVTVYAFLCAYLPAHGTRLLRLSATPVISSTASPLPPYRQFDWNSKCRLGRLPGAVLKQLNIHLHQEYHHPRSVQGWIFLTRSKCSKWNVCVCVGGGALGGQTHKNWGKVLNACCACGCFPQVVWAVSFPIIIIFSSSCFDTSGGRPGQG